MPVQLRKEPVVGYGSPFGRTTRAARQAAVRMRPRRYSLPGGWVALILAGLSFTPSLLPRSAWFQGTVTGISAAIGYGIGVLGALVWREFADRGPRAPRRGAWRAFLLCAGVGLLVALLLGLRWQRQLRQVVGLPPEPVAASLLVPLVAVVLFVALVAAGRGVRAAYRGVAGLLQQRMGARAARALGAVLLVWAGALLFSGLLWDGFVGMVDRSFALRDSLTPSDVQRPLSGLRSGSPASVVSWDSLGREGRVFTGRGPTATSIAEFSGVAARDPIRAFAGMESAETAEARAELAVRDLRRAGGFDREYLLVVTTTGTGWVEPSSVSSFEYLTGGDSATVAIQYSHLPSWMSYLVDQERAREAGRALFDAVYARWSSLPADDRPELMVFGESLGSFGAEAAFSGEADLAIRTDGALFVGPPSFNPLYRDFVEDRGAASPEVQPVYRGGRTIRFTNRPGDTIPPASTPWTGTRVLYMQHPTDPITWWHPDLLLTRPDWLEEAPGRDRTDDMVWIPVVTFWQVSADLALGFSAPPGHGHVYTGEHVDGWAAVIDPPGWSQAKADRLKAIIVSRR